jgi:hypothetical protein
VRRFFSSDEMSRLSDALAYQRPDIARAVGEDSEMVDGGYIADLSSSQVAYLAEQALPTGAPASREEESGHEG